MELATSAERGDTVVAVIIFTGCSPKESGNCNSTVDFRLLRPDGSVYANHEGGELWIDKPAPPDGELQLSVASLGFLVEEDDTLGTYVLQARVHDHIGDISIDLEQAIDILATTVSPSNFEAGDEAGVLKSEADIQGDMRRLLAVADGWPPRIETPEEREAVEHLWHQVEARVLKMASLAPDDYHLTLWLGDCYRMGHNLDIEGAGQNAISYLRAASELSPAEPTPHLLLGAHFTFSGRPVEGESEYLKAIDLSAEPLPHAFYGLANAYYFQNNFQAAVDYADKFLQHRPDNKAITFLRERATATLNGEFEPRTIEVLSDEKPDGIIKAVTEDEPEND